MIIYLLVKQHSVTGMKYFCKTTRKDPYKYIGSGTYWRKHIIFHGTQYVNTLKCWKFKDQASCNKFALRFSKMYKIVESENWANLIPEDGVRGGSAKGRVFSEDHKAKLKGRKRSDETRKKISDNHTRPMLGKKFSDETKLKMSENNVGFIGRHHSSESRAKTSATLKGKTKNYFDLVCPHCGKIGKGPNMGRYHFTKCKHK